MSSQDPLQAEPEPQQQGPVEQLQSFDRWQQIGRHALRLEERPVLETLRNVLKDCAALIVYEHWRANGQNVTKTAEALGMSRRRVRMIVDERKQAPSTDGGEPR